MTEQIFTPFDLRNGLPFPYDDYAVSQISNTEAFVTGIDKRDAEHCVVCGIHANEGILEHAHIVPKSEPYTVRVSDESHALSYLTLIQWENLRTRQFIPRQAKTVEHEARNGLLLCKNHHSLFDAYRFYIRWIPGVCFNMRLTLIFSFLSRYRIIALF
jgi:hypothetical protein